MKKKTMSRAASLLLTLALLLSLFPLTVAAAPSAAPAVPVTFTILHTNDFHGQLEPSGSNPGMARTAAVVNGVRTAKGTANVLLLDAGDAMQGSLLSNLGDGTPTGKGIPTVATYNAMGYGAATFGNHEFDWGQVNLKNRTDQAAYPFVTANIVQNNTGNCATAGWTPPAFVDAPYQILTVGSPVSVKVAVIGVSTTETPIITISTATAGLCFKDPAESIIHYYDAMKADGADVIVVLSHLGNTDSGGGYGLPVYGDQTLAQKLTNAGKPVHLIIGGHSHTDLSAAQTPLNTTTKVVQAHYNGRKVGQADITVGTDGSVTVNWQRLTVSTTGAEDAGIKSVINTYATDPYYLSLVNTPVGYSAVDLGRFGGTVDNMMATFIDDAIYNYLNTDTEPANDVDLFFNNSGGIRTDWCWDGAKWISPSPSTCTASGTHAPGLLNYGHMFTILPFGNATITGKMTGAQILEVINNGPLIAGVIQPAGLKYKYYKYTDTLAPGSPGNPPTTPASPYTYAWGAYDVQVYDKGTSSWLPLDLKKTYNVGTNEFLAPGGGDGYNAFKYMTNVMSWGDMLNAVNAYVSAHYGTPETAYTGPNGDGTLDDRILRDGDGDNTYDGGNEIVPLTILHHNDSHGNMYKGSFAGYTQLATLIKQEKLHNPGRTLLLSSGDNIQGDGFSFYFKTAPDGVTSDGTPIPVVPGDSMHIQPLIKAFNIMGYDAMVLGNHEFNFGKDVFTSVLSQATFPLLQANVEDDGSYGLAEANIQDYVEKDLGDIDVAILGIGNHRIPNYELPSNIPGLTFSDPIAKAQELSGQLHPTNDVVIALTHIGFTENPASVEVDANVDTNMAATVTGLDAIVGGHSHTDPSKKNINGASGNYHFLPAIVAGPDDNPVIVGQAYRYNNTLGEIVLGLRPDGTGGYDVITSTGRYLSVSMSTTSPTPEDPTVKAIVDPYVVLFNGYNNTVIGQTTTPIDTTYAYIAETNAANLQADAAIYELASHDITDVDFHLSGAMTRPSSSSNWIMFPTASEATPAQMKISDMFTLMPYENSLVVLSMNGPQLKAVLERAYRNYYYYKYVPGQGGYSYYTTCMINADAGTQITYNDLGAGTLPTGNNVVSLTFDGNEVDFTDAETFYNVSTVNYLAAGSCNFNDGGVSLWPLNQIVADTQYYVRDAVINYAMHEETIGPVVEGRLQFIYDVTPPTITITSPTATSYLHPEFLTLNFSATDDVAGVKKIWADLDGVAVTNGQVIDLYTLSLGDHTLTVYAMDKAYNQSSAMVTFTVTATVDSLMASVNRFATEGKIDDNGVLKSLLQKLQGVQDALKKGQTTAAINKLGAFINEVQAQSGKHITPDAADLLIADAQWVIDHLK